LKELEYDADIAPAPDSHLVFAQGMHRHAADVYLASSRAVYAGDHVDQGGLAAARFADDGDEFAFVEIRVNAFQHGELTSGVVIGLDQIAQSDKTAAIAVVAPNF